jgi:hypothetical protein
MFACGGRPRERTAAEELLLASSELRQRMAQGGDGGGGAVVQDRGSPMRASISEREGEPPMPQQRTASGFFLDGLLEQRASAIDETFGAINGAVSFADSLSGTGGWRVAGGRPRVRTDSALLAGSALASTQSREAQLQRRERLASVAEDASEAAAAAAATTTTQQPAVQRRRLISRLLSAEFIEVLNQCDETEFERLAELWVVEQERRGLLPAAVEEDAAGEEDAPPPSVPQYPSRSIRADSAAAAVLAAPAAAALSAAAAPFDLASSAEPSPRGDGSPPTPAAAAAAAAVAAVAVTEPTQQEQQQKLERIFGWAAGGSANDAGSGETILYRSGMERISEVLGTGALDDEACEI